MTTAKEICREEFTQDQLKRLLARASWEALFPIALEMGFETRTLAGLNYDHVELRSIMKQQWRETASRLTQCQASYKKIRKENDAQRQIVMDFHLKEKSQ